MNTLLRDLLTGTLDLVFAPVCVACDNPISPASRERGICLTCWARARTLPLPRCDRCWMPLRDLGTGDLAPCSCCPDLRPAVRYIRSVYIHEGPVRAMVHALKYRGWHAIAESIGRRMATVELPAEVTEEVELIIPVPVSAARRRQRGYNQAEMIGTAIALIRGWKCRADLLLRTRSSGSQTALHPSERRANVAGAFAPRDGVMATLGSRHVCLVDDVWTTGATALACADTLLDAGARAVTVLTFARALPEVEGMRRRIEAIASI